MTAHGPKIAPYASENDASPAFEMQPRRPAVSVGVYEALLTKLISLKIAPGSRISVDGLVKELGVSQTPIRSALVRLEAEGLVVRTHLVGFSAAPMPSRGHFEQIYEMRLLLEPAAAAKAARLLTPTDGAALGEMHAAMAALSSGDARLGYGKFATWDAAFHARIATGGGSHLIAETLAGLHTHMHLFRLLFHSRVTEEAIQEHAELIKSLSAGDPEAAYVAMERHILLSQKRMAPVFECLE
jgi:DNA-binding GntR family transcriptional regulator